MNKIKPIAGMVTPRFADIATFFRLPIIKDLSKLDYCICGIAGIVDAVLAYFGFGLNA